ncbi:hypothetical protein ACFX2I_025483 [Malus domestica]
MGTSKVTCRTFDKILINTGDRHFSKWKGSVVDSVIGVFLTQNVSDHLPSSAFMSLAARFPLKSSNHKAQRKVGTNILVKEPAVRKTSPDDVTKWHKDMSSQPIYHPISRTLRESEDNQRDSETSGTERNLVEAQGGLEEEFVSSQDSFESPVTQGAAGNKLYSGSIRNRRSYHWVPTQEGLCFPFNTSTDGESNQVSRRLQSSK